MEFCPPYAPFIGLGGAASALIFTTLGAAYGTAKSGIGIAGMSTVAPNLVMKSLIPVVMSGVIAVYGLVSSVLIVNSMDSGKEYSLFQGFIHLASGLSCGIAGVAGGVAIGHVGNAGVLSFIHQSRVYVSMVLMLIFAEVLSLYGLIVALILNTLAGDAKCFRPE